LLYNRIIAGNRTLSTCFFAGSGIFLTKLPLQALIQGKVASQLSLTLRCLTLQALLHLFKGLNSPTTQPRIAIAGRVFIIVPHFSLSDANHDIITVVVPEFLHSLADVSQALVLKVAKVAQPFQHLFALGLGSFARHSGSPVHGVEYSRACAVVTQKMNDG
jgi:hypothetical protein